jgi:DNA-directed RNA polymerase alpha subunit
MTDRNIDVMDLIVSKMIEGDKLSKALHRVYNKRNVCIPYSESDLEISIMKLGMSGRTTNTLLRAKIRTIGDVVEFCEEQKITKITNFGRNSGIELFEAMLDYCWEHMNQDKRVSFLIDTVERNSGNIREDIA